MKDYLPGTKDFSDKLKKLRNKLRTYKPFLTAAYIFGSTARGKVKPLSDIDFAVLYSRFDPRVDSQIYQIVSKTFGTDRIDFLNINEAPLRLQYQIIKEGIKLFTDKETERIDFETDVILKYSDFQHIQKEFYQEYLNTL